MLPHATLAQKARLSTFTLRLSSALTLACSLAALTVQLYSALRTQQHTMWMVVRSTGYANPCRRSTQPFRLPIIMLRANQDATVATVRSCSMTGGGSSTAVRPLEFLL